jgi:penicillin G amidase
VLLDPVDGLYRTARHAGRPPASNFSIPGLDSSVTIIRDSRGVPHIFASSDKDAIMATGYAVAQDRLFQMDFYARAASGRLSEVLGASALPIDRMFRQIGMEIGARRNLERIYEEGGVERDIIEWYTAGANAYIDAVAEDDLPFEFRLLGYSPERYEPINALRLMQYMAYDLSFHSDAASYGLLRSRLSESDYRLLYPMHATLSVPIIPSGEGGSDVGESLRLEATPEADPSALSVLRGFDTFRKGLLQTVAEGFVQGKGSNSWAVHGSRSTTGAPILADDMHLGLSLPSLWYEVHLATPSMNVYGVTFPAAPVPIQAYNNYVGWGFTNTGSDQIDHYALTLNDAGTQYHCGEKWCDVQTVLDTIYVRDAQPVIDTLYHSHFGPIIRDGEGAGAVAIRWTGHEENRTLLALWGMLHARNHEEFEAAVRNWDAPMQNILYADVAGNIAIRATGYLPIRRAGHGAGLLDGTTDTYEWTGRVPFEDLPASFNPAQGWLASANQQPADSTYAHYTGHDWRPVYRSLRIQTLLSAKERHSVEDLGRYQSDVHAVQRDLFVPLLDSIDGLSPRADSIRLLLLAWDGDTSVDRPEPLVMFEFLNALENLAWDEVVFEGVTRPGQQVLYRLLTQDPANKWLDEQSTPEREGTAKLLGMALERTATLLEQYYGWGVANWRWGDHHKILFRHVTRSEALGSLWRGPMEYPGFAETLSPGADLITTHSASWRVVIDFSTREPEGWGIYPGGQSGDPFSPFYDLHIPSYLSFQHYRLLKPASPEELDSEPVPSRIILTP